jgi:2-dehydro-3-deoxygluconokinase
MAKVVTFGEIMMRLASPLGERFEQTTNFEVVYGGAEANVAVAIARYGGNSRFVSKVSDDQFGDAAIGNMKIQGVDTGFVQKDKGRLGKYFYEYGYSQRPSKVIYDRDNSVFANSKPGDFDWEKIFSDATWFHFTGITPALSDGLIETCEVALTEAKKRGITVSCDLNYRARLWSKEKARKVMTSLMKNTDVLFANEEDSESVFGMKAEDTNVSDGRLSVEGYRDVATRLMATFDLKAVAISLRESVNANFNRWSASLLTGGEFMVSTKYDINIIDRVGGGDAFAAGLIFGLDNSWEPRKALEFGVAASCLKHTIKGDFNIVSRDEVEKLLGGNTSGRVVR